MLISHIEVKTAYFSNPLFLQHQTGASHPERAARLTTIERHLRETGLWEQLEHLEFQPAPESAIEACHTHAHLQRVKSLAQHGGGALDGDTVISYLSFDAALLASGAAMRAVDAVMKGEMDNAFVASRPPGHHAESGRRESSLWGFCLFNHIAVAARHAQREWELERVAILDFDVHHGNGTQEIFYEDGSVFFASLHEWRLFPYQGGTEETGAGAGLGKTLNFPLPAGSDGEVYRDAWAQVGAAVEQFAPQLILVSAGFDGHDADPLAHMRLQTEDFTHLVSEAKAWAKRLCDGKLILVLEGGYNLEALAESVAATLSILKAD